MFAVTPAFGGCGFGRITTGRRNDDAVPRPTAVATKHTKLTKRHKENLVSLFDGLRPATTSGQSR